ncbi:hypothetical protein [Halosegnis longus]|nr:hypothetical protein [Salella cibi]
MNDDTVELQYERYGSERLRRFFNFFGFHSTLEEESEPDNDE